MARRYAVNVQYTTIRHREINVWADDADEAEEKAVDVVLAWDSVTDAEAIDCQEDD